MAVITVSRGTFSGGLNLAESIAERLGYRCLARIELAEAAGRYGVSEEKLSEAISGSPGVLERLSSQRMHYLACLRAALVREVKNDNVVYHGLAGHFLLSGVPQILKVKVISNLEFRINAAMERSHLTREDAVQFIKTVDEKRARWTKFLYHVDWNDPSLYDLIINLEQISLSSACEIVCHTAGLDEFKTTPEREKIIEDLTLSTEVRAIIAANAAGKSISDAGIEIEADNGVVTIGGTVGSLQDADKIREIVRTTIPGVSEVKTKMRVHR